MVKYVVLIFMSLLVFQAHAMSNPYRGGEVGILIKNDRPCFYIPDPKQNGLFSVTMIKFSTQQKQKIEWRYLGYFENYSPSKDNCIVWEQNQLSNNQDIFMDMPYVVTFGAKEKAYRSEFCVTKRNERVVLQKASINGCYDPPKSKWQSLKGLFH